jgi:hypothetical protein
MPAEISRQSETVELPRVDLDNLLAVATLYVNSFTDDDRLSLVERLRLQEVEQILDRLGRRY